MMASDANEHVGCQSRDATLASRRRRRVTIISTASVTSRLVVTLLLPRHDVNYRENIVNSHYCANIV